MDNVGLFSSLCPQNGFRLHASFTPADSSRVLKDEVAGRAVALRARPPSRRYRQQPVAPHASRPVQMPRELPALPLPHGHLQRNSPPSPLAFHQFVFVLSLSHSGGGYTRFGLRYHWLYFPLAKTSPNLAEKRVPTSIPSTTNVLAEPRWYYLQYRRYFKRVIWPGGCQ